MRSEPEAVQADKGKADQQLAALSKALGHPVRVEIMRQLRERDSCACGDLVIHLPVAQSTVSQHLKVLKQAGLITGSASGACTSYRINQMALERFKTLVITL